MLPSQLGRLCNSVPLHFGMAGVGHHHGAIPSVTGSHPGVQVDKQDKDMADTDHLLSQESGIP